MEVEVAVVEAAESRRMKGLGVQVFGSCRCQRTDAIFREDSETDSTK